MELTKTEFEQILDKKLANVVTKDDLKGFATKEDLKAFITKEDFKSGLESLEKNLKEFTKDEIEKLAMMINETINMPLQEHINSCNKVLC